MHLIVVGAQRSGTTWLYDMMRQHPQVGFSFLKEVHYFDKVGRAEFSGAEIASRVGQRLRNVPSWRHRIDYTLQKLSPDWRRYYAYVLDPQRIYTDEWYRGIFDRKPDNVAKVARHGDFVRADFTPRYMAMPNRAMSHMAQVLPDAEPYLILRDPVKRMISSLSMLETRSGDRSEVSSKRTDQYLSSGRANRADYQWAIPALRSHFPSLRIVPFKRIITDPHALLREIEEVHGLDRHTYRNVAGKRNSRSGKIRVPEQQINKIRAACQPQYDYLESEFGSDFLTEI